MTQYRRRPGITETPVEDEMFLVPGDGGDIFHLDRMALPIWRALERPASEQELQQLFQDAFPEVPAETIARDLADAIAALVRGKLIELCD